MFSRTKLVVMLLFYRYLLAGDFGDVFTITAVFLTKLLHLNEPLTWAREILKV